MEEQDSRYENPDNDPRGPWKSGGLDVKTYSADYDYPITVPSGRIVIPPAGKCWRYSRARFAELVNDNRIWFGKTGNNVPSIKRFLTEVKQGITPLTVWLYSDVGHTQSGTQELNQLSIEFANPKPHTLIEQICRIGSDSDAIVLDSFAGSGTTAHAVLALNKEDGGSRRFILVECENYADTITAERVRRVINGVPGARDRSLREGLGGSFTYCTLGEPIEVEGMLTGEALPAYEPLAAHLLYTVGGVSAGGEPLVRQNEDGLFYSNGSTDYYLLYEPDVEWLRDDRKAMLNNERAKRIETASQIHGSQAIVFAAGKYVGQRELSRMRITFCQLPYELHRPGLTR